MSAVQEMQAISVPSALPLPKPPAIEGENCDHFVRRCGKEVKMVS